MNVKIDTKRNVLIIEAPLQTPQPSVSGKTLVIASTRGNLKTDVKFTHDGQERVVTIGLNAYVAK